jgi:hypothetical protein
MIQLNRKEWVLLKTVYPEAIQQFKSQMQLASENLNRLNELVPITSEAEFTKFKEGINEWVKAEMLKDAEIQKLSKFVNIDSIILPDNLLKIKNAVNATSGTITHTHLGRVSVFNYMKFKTDKWVLLHDEIESTCDQFRLFANTKQHLEKLRAAQILCDYINTIKIGLYSREGFVNVMVTHDSVGNFTPAIDFVFSSEDRFIS